VGAGAPTAPAPARRGIDMSTTTATTTSDKPLLRRPHWRRVRTLQGVVYALPTLIFVIVLFVLPLLLVVQMSGSQWKLLTGHRVAAVLGLLLAHHRAHQPAAAAAGADPRSHPVLPDDERRAALDRLPGRLEVRRLLHADPAGGTAGHLIGADRGGIDRRRGAL